jgi:zinc transport system ATP-binding protein
MKDKNRLISFDDVWIGYDNKPMIRNLNLDIYESDYITVIGENGVGKSTLIKTVLGLLNPVSGKIVMDNKLGIGYLPQQTQVQRDFPASVYEVVISGFLNKANKRPFYSSTEKKNALKNMELLQIQDLKRHCYRELSGGQQQRVLLARAICAANKLLILDEPVTGLDPNAARDLYDNLKVLNKENEMAIIMISHDIQNALLQADKVLHLTRDTWQFCLAEEYLKNKGRQVNVEVSR